MSLPAIVQDGSPSKARAAALMLAIGTGRAGSVLDHLKPAEVRALAEAVASLGELDPQARQLLMQGALSSMLTTDPVAEARALRDKARRLKASDVPTEAEIDPERPFEFLERVDTEQVVRFLMSEHPQTVAVILSARPPEFASKILAQFDSHIAGDIAFRIATIGRTPADVVHHIEKVIRQRLTEAEDEVVDERDGARELAAILNQAGRDFENRVLEHLAKSDPELAERVKALMFVFEDVVLLEDRAIQQVLQNVNSATLALAMKGVGDEVKDVILRNLSERAKEALNEEIDLLGAVRKQEVEDARTAVVAQIRALEEAGTITINRGQEGDLVE